LYENVQRQLYEEFKIQASLHGAEITDEKDNVGTGTQQTQPKTLFPDPKQFEHLSDEEKKKKTEELMAKHKMFFNQKARVTE